MNNTGNPQQGASNAFACVHGIFYFIAQAVKLWLLIAPNIARRSDFSQEL